MATKVHMEALSPTMEEGQIVRWLKAEGDAVANGDIIAEIETDKATMELVARGDGVLRAIFLGEGSTAPVGDVIAVIAGAEEDIGEFGGSHGVATASEPTGAGPVSGLETAPAEPSQAGTPGDGDGGDSAGEGSGPAGRVKASPLARRLAEDAGVDLVAVVGSGPGGRVVKKDVEAAAAAATGERAPSPVQPRTDHPTPRPLLSAVMGGMEGPEFEDIPLSQMRKTIARRLTESIGPVPHFFLTIDVDMDRAMEARGRMNALLETYGTKVSVNDMVIRAAAAALRLHPAVNAAWMGDAVRRHNRIHIGVAVAVEDGLITPVVRDADRKGMAQIGQEVREMAGRAREKKLQPEEYTGATFSISNLGMFGIHEFTAVINPPEAAILAVGGVEDSAVVVDGRVEVRSRMKVTMSCDHRVVDGATGAKFLATLRQMLEEPAAILV